MLVYSIKLATLVTKIFKYSKSSKKVLINLGTYSGNSFAKQCSQGVDTAGCPEIFWAVWAGCASSVL